MVLFERSAEKQGAIFLAIGAALMTSKSTNVLAATPYSTERPKVSQSIFFVFRVPEVAEMAAVWIKRHLVAQGFFERFDGFPFGHEIVGVVHNVDFGIAAQPINDAC